MTRLESAIAGTVRGLAILAGGAVLVMMLLTCADVFMRYVFNAPVEGTFDFTLMLMVVVVFFAMGYCGWTGGHVVVDVLRDVIPRRLLVSSAVMVNLVGAAVMLAISWESLLTAFDFMHTGETPMTVLIPKYPFILVVSFGALTYTIVLLFKTFRPDEGADGRTDGA